MLNRDINCPMLNESLFTAILLLQGMALCKDIKEFQFFCKICCSTVARSMALCPAPYLLGLAWRNCILCSFCSNGKLYELQSIIYELLSGDREPALFGKAGVQLADREGSGGLKLRKYQKPQLYFNKLLGWIVGISGLASMWRVIRLDDEF